MAHKVVINRITTAELATELKLKPQSVRKRYCTTGSYFSITPCKLPNGKLLWPEDTVDRLLARGVK
jgi:hypothetical protein